MDDRECRQCREFLALRQRELKRWLQCPTELSGHGYISMQAFDRLIEHPSVPSRVNRSIEEIDAAGQVLWLDLDAQGHWHVWAADHGATPPEVTREG